MFKSSSNFLTDRFKAVLLLWIIFAICVSVCFFYQTVLPVPCSLVDACWERADLLALLCVVLSLVFVTFPYGVLGQVWYLIMIVSVPDICLLPYCEKLQDNIYEVRSSIE